MREIIAIVRGVKPDEIVDIAEALLEAGIAKIEVPLNSPDPLVSIEKLVSHFSNRALVGGGTVLTADQVKGLSQIGAKLVVSPDCNASVIQMAKSNNMLSYPGVFTPTECFQALRFGADGLKLFPAFRLGTEGYKAIKAVLPVSTKTYAVGGVSDADFASWKEAGVTGFGMGTSLYKPGMKVKEVFANASRIVAAYDKAIST